jgi:hypothetical protein
VTELDNFARDLLEVAPAVAEVLREAGEELSADPELPTVWMGYAGRALAS